MVRIFLLLEINDSYLFWDFFSMVAGLIEARKHLALHLHGGRWAGKNQSAWIIFQCDEAARDVSSSSSFIILLLHLYIPFERVFVPFPSLFLAFCLLPNC